MSIGTVLALSKDVTAPPTTNQVGYDLRHGDKGSSEYAVAGLALPLERVLTISHTEEKSGNRRHLVRLDRTEVDGLNSPATVSTYVVIVVPPNTVITNVIVKEEVARLSDFLLKTVNSVVQGNVDKILNSEV